MTFRRKNQKYTFCTLKSVRATPSTINQTTIKTALNSGFTGILARSKGFFSVYHTVGIREAVQGLQAQFVENQQKYVCV